MVKTKWLASLSDGSTAIEGTEPFEVRPGELSPWLRLQEHLKETGLHITGLRVQASKPDEPTKTYNLPTYNKTASGRHEKWNRYPIQPVRYNYFRWAEAEWGGRKKPTEMSTRYIEIQAIYPDYTVSLFVDEIEGNESWVVVHREQSK